MKFTSSFTVIFGGIILFAGCKNSIPEQKNIPTDSTTVADSVSIANDTRLIIQDLAANGDYVNSREFPSLIKASAVMESMNKNILIIDLRQSHMYVQGHIKGSVNKKFEELPGYFETGIKPFEYDKIVLVCEDGQISSYTASLLRLMGYGNVYAMRWGISSWNKNAAGNAWLSGLSSKYESQLEKTTNEKPVAKTMPELKTGLTAGADIAAARFKSVFAEGTGQVLVTSDEVFAHPEKYFIMNYERKDKYDDAHIPGAVRYKPAATLGFIEEMSTIPADKSVVVYCGTGHNSGFATAYLRLLGYDAHTLKYGNNGFMVDWMKKDAANLSWLPFSEAEINNYPLVKN